MISQGPLRATEKNLPESALLSERESSKLNELAFQRAIAVERKRTERSGNAFVLALVDVGRSLPEAEQRKLLEDVMTALSTSTREIDIAGWYKQDCVAGVMFTQVASNNKNTIESAIAARIATVLTNRLTSEQFSRINISFHLFPEEWGSDVPPRTGNDKLYPDLEKRDQARRVGFGIKRAIDIAGSALGLVLGAPIFLAVAVALKLSSRGPIFYRQQRVGQYGRHFTLLKFRSMNVDSDAAVHKDYVKRLIAGEVESLKLSNGQENTVYKITNDERVTRVGAFLRRTSLDELPQFINVLKGEMSLVGPRPPVPYEVDHYYLWHRRRLLDAKPGITGLWQVNGRSRVNFDESVRLDLTYARRWSLWLDIVIILRTPWAVVIGDGAY